MRLIETNQTTRESATNAGGEPQIPIQVHANSSSNEVGATNRQSFHEQTGESTWELLLNDEPAVRDANTSNNGTLIREVSTDLCLHIVIDSPPLEGVYERTG